MNELDSQGSQEVRLLASNSSVLFGVLRFLENLFLFLQCRPAAPIPGATSREFTHYVTAYPDRRPDNRRKRLNGYGYTHLFIFAINKHVNTASAKH